MSNNNYKIILAISVIIIIAGGIFGHLAINKYKTDVRTITDVELSMEQAVREVEVSVWETANSIFYYMLEPSAMSLEEYKKQLNDVKTFMAKYAALVDNDKQKQVIAKFQNMWNSSVAKAEELIKLINKMKEAQEKAWDSVHKTGDIIDYKIQAAFVEGLADLTEKQKAVHQVEVSVCKAINLTSYYSQKQFDSKQKDYLRKLKNVNKFWKKYKSLNITPAEEPFIKEFDDSWNLSVKFMNECFSLTDELKQKYLAFWESVHTADDVIDFEIQEALKKKIETRKVQLTQ